MATMGHVGQKVKETGYYICNNCGNYQYFEVNDEFEACELCGEEDITWEPES